MAINRVVNNASWIIGSKILQSILNLIIGMLSARYLGPSNYGIISFAASIVAFVTPFTKLGLNSTLVQELTDRPDKDNEILGTSLFLNVGSSLLCILSVVGFAYAVDRNDKTTQIVCIIYSLSLVFQATEMISYWFQAKLKSKFPSVAVVIASFFASSYKIFILATGKSVFWFAATNIIQYFLISLLLIVIYFRSSKKVLTFSFNTAKQLLSRSKFYIISSLMIVVYQQTDHIMIKTMLGDAENGYYTAAMTCAGIIGFVYAAIIDSLRPVILKAKKQSQELYEKYITLSYSFVFYLSALQSILMTLLARPIIMVLFGQQYSPAIPLLQICVWYVTYAYFGSIRNIWIQGEGKHKYVWIIDLIGATINVVLNAVMITALGAAGAALSSVISQVFMNFIFGFIFPPIRENNMFIIRGLNPKYLVEAIKLAKIKSSLKE